MTGVVAEPASSHAQSHRKANIGVLLLLSVALPLATAAAMPKLVTSANWMLGAEAIATAVAAVSINLLLGYAGQLSLGHAGLLGAGAFASGVITSRNDLPFWVGLPTALVVGALFALVIGLPALRLRGLYLAIVTLVFGIAVEYSVLPGTWLSGAGGSSGFPLPKRVWGSHLLTDSQIDSGIYLTVCLVLLIAVCVVDDNVVRTRLGRAMRALKENEAVAAAHGVNVTRYKLLAFVVSGGMAGLAGALDGHAKYSVSSESYTLLLSLQLVTIVVVGGIGRRRAVVATALAFTLLPDAIGAVQGYQYAIGAALLLLTLTRNPNGLGELPTLIRDELARRRAVREGIAVPGYPQPSTNDEPLLPQFTMPDVTPRAPMHGARHASVHGVLREPSGRANLLEVSDVTVRFGGLTAVDHASLVVPRGKIVGLIGPNGAGKSTLFNAVSGLVRCESGVVSFDGREVQGLRADQRARLGLARGFQHVGLALDLSVVDNLLLAQHQLATYGDAAALVMAPKVAREESELRARADAAVESLGLGDHAHKPLRNLSGGQQRLVEMAALLLTGPELVMLDEPSAGMSPGAAERLADRLRDLRDSLGRTVLIIEHNVPLVFDCCDLVYVLDAGVVVASGEPAEIARDQRVIDAYFGAHADLSVPERAIATSGTDKSKVIG
ncbi:MAG TPA: branched-chain amino acid ABC transporter ATP-binding protein/permease [Mycobacteriales bacterium]|nr:branched-chain amino acid ABC transporter ATP-binding protein/permease [Mycobacteriales bacterium]